MKTKRQTKELPLVKRLLARLIHKLQLIFVKKPISMGLYYFLAKVHFKLHYGFSIQHGAESKLHESSNQMAIRRHMRIVVNSGLMSESQVKLFKPQIEKAFIDGINKVR